MSRIEMMVNGTKFYISNEHGFSSDWHIDNLPDGYTTWSSNLLHIMAIALEHLGENTIANYLKERETMTIKKSFSYDVCPYSEKDWTISTAEDEFRKWLKKETNNHYFGRISLNALSKPIYEDEYEGFDEEAYLYYLIQENIGWEVSSINDVLDRQHMCVTLILKWGQIDPQWAMEFRNPTYTSCFFDLDKMKEKARKKAEAYKTYETAISDAYDAYLNCDKD